jgi:lipopolysaccharide biosynthesis protein
LTMLHLVYSESTFGEADPSRSESLPLGDRTLRGADEAIGLVFPDHPNIHGWGKNLSYAVDLAKRLGISALLPKATFNFPVGCMFWAKTAALRPLFELGLTWDDYPLEPASYDGSLLHAIERILPFSAKRRLSQCRNARRRRNALSFSDVVKRRHFL